MLSAKTGGIQRSNHVCTRMSREAGQHPGTGGKDTCITGETDRQRRLYETILSNTPDLVYVFGLDRRFVYANKALLTMWGRDWKDAIGKSLLELGYEPWHAEMHEREIDQVIATRKPIRGEVPFTGTHGRRIYDYIFVPVLGENGEVEAIAGATRDITDREMAEEALRESEERFRAFVTATSDVVYSMNGDWSEMRHLQGMKFIADTNEPNRNWLNKYIPPSHREYVMEAINEAIRTVSPFQLEHKVIRSDGTVGWTFSRAIPLKGVQGEIGEWFGAARDVTKRKQAEELLAEQAKHLERLVQERTAALSETIAELEAFSYSVSHDMRSPLRAMQGFAEMLMTEKSDLLDEDGKEYLGRILKGAQRLDLLIQDILAYSKIAKGTAPLTPVRLDAICDDIIRAYPELQGERAQVKLQSPLHCVLAHEAFLAQILSNLLSNAVKFVPANQMPIVTVRSELLDEETVRV